MYNDSNHVLSNSLLTEMGITNLSLQSTTLKKHKAINIPHTTIIYKKFIKNLFVKFETSTTNTYSNLEKKLFRQHVKSNIDIILKNCCQG